MMSFKLRYLRSIELGGKITLNTEMQGKDLEESGRAVFKVDVSAFQWRKLKSNIKISHTMITTNLD